MDQDLKTRWMAALNSGQYRQGTGLLRYGANDAPEYCCLGVLCDLLKPTGWRPIDFTGHITHRLGDPCNTHLLASTCTKIGLLDEDMSSLIDLNDGGCTFPEIAEENL